ncbi:MAG: TolC family protein, partial [Acetobacteraceae bacterium]|nr:TolC family protein [Acetobacteraceae bacterium]
MKCATLQRYWRAGAAAALTTVIALGGCAAGPDFRRPEPPQAAAYTPAPQPADTEAASGPGGAAQHFVPAETIGGAWWHAFGSPALDQLVQRALDNSPTLAQAQMRLAQAQQDYLAQAGATEWPQLDASLKATRSKPDPAAAGLSNLVGGRSFPPFTLYSAQVSVSYSLDLFGANRRALEALAAQVDYQQYELEAARLSLAGNVVTAAVRRASLAKQIALSEALLAEENRQLEITQRRFDAGGVSRMDLLSQRSQVAQTRASLAPLRAQLAQTDHQLAVYMGLPPGQLASTGEADPGALNLDALVLPAEV